jgi:flavorubredoxin
MLNITDSIAYIGVLNPNMRVFDVIMRTEFGTSYNAYLVRGAEKVAVIEAVHKSFGAWFEDKLEDALDGAKVDYLVLNHTEPDHSGSVAAFAEKYPDTTIVLSQSAAVFLPKITNRTDLKLRIVKDGESIDLGGKTLQFISAPFLHWPDSMFTYVPEEKTLFSCDFLGAHYCEPQVFDAKIAFADSYRASVRHYYDCIFGPFASYVRSGLAKIADLPLDFVCPSHGPVLSRGVRLEETVASYAQWAAPKRRENKLIPLFYCSAYQNTAALAARVRAGILRVFPDADAPLFNIIEHDAETLAGILNDSDAFLLGTPTINRQALPPGWRLVSLIDGVNIAKRPVALFGSYGWSGEGFTHIAAQLTALKTALFEEQFKINFTPGDADLAEAEQFGERFARSL